ncbi:hypothetical protein LCGC14_1261440 [marine sediment metagenome]|uniref:Uncharacterized protein n=1 Tax=marine sediment metagenome TaxID=412755 RepID=A0A0F9L319_9ZZZZ
MKHRFMGMVTEFISGMTRALNVFQERAISISSIGNAVFDHFYLEGAWLKDLYVENSEIFAVATQGGKLFRASVEVDEDTGDVEVGEMIEVVVNFDPVSRAELHTTKDGKVRMMSVSATTVLNKRGMIDSRDLFDSMADFMQRTGKSIPRTFFHLGEEYRSGDVVWMGRDENVLVTVTEFDDSELAEREIAARERNPDYWGDSIEFQPVGDPEMLEVEDGITIPVYRAGIPIAVSIVPAKYACSLYADKFVIKKQEVRMALTEVEQEELVELFDGDEDEVKNWLKDNVSPINRSIAEKKQITRANAEEKETSEEEETTEEETTEGETTEEETTEGKTSEEESEEEETSENLVLEFTDEMAEEVADSVVKSSGFSEFQETVQKSLKEFGETIATLTGTVTELQATSVTRAKEVRELQKKDSEKQKQWMEDLPRNTNRTVTLHRPSENAETEAAEKSSMQETADETLAGLKQ